MITSRIIILEQFYAIRPVLDVLLNESFIKIYDMY